MESLNQQLKALELKLERKKDTLKAITELYYTTRSKKESLEAQLKVIHDEIEAVKQGQVNFDLDGF